MIECSMGASKVGVTHLNILQLAAWNDEKISNIGWNVELDSTTGIPWKRREKVLEIRLFSNIHSIHFFILLIVTY